VIDRRTRIGDQTWLLSQDVVEREAVGDLALVLRLYEELDLVAFFHDLPRHARKRARRSG
jgi:hypothetical protein